MDAETMRAKLAEIGTSLGDYSQNGVRQSKLLSQHVGEGMCQGACLDWIRRMLLGKTLKPFANGVSGKQYLKSALLHLTLESSKQPYLEAEKSRVLSQGQEAFDAQKDQKLQTVKDMYQKGFAEMEKKKAANLGLTYVEQTNKWVGQRDKLTQLQDEMKTWGDKTWDMMERQFQVWADSEAKAPVNTDHLYKEFWEYFCQQWNTLGPKALVKDGEGAKLATLVKPASSISQLGVVLATPFKVYSGQKTGEASLAYIREVTQSPHMLPYRAALLEVTPPRMNDPGHAVAIFMQNTSTYLLFDPNVGVYELDTRGLARAFIYLFAVAYPDKSSPSGLRDARDYEVDFKIGGIYVIFKGPGADDAIPRVLQPVSKNEAT